MTNKNATNATAQVCKSLMDNALAGCVVTADGQVSFFFGDDGLVNTDAQCAGELINTIGKLLNQQRNLAN